MNTRNLALTIMGLVLTALLVRPVEGCNNTNETVSCCKAGYDKKTVQLNGKSKDKACADITDNGGGWTPCGVPELKLSPYTGAIYVRDMPIFLSQSKGPSFGFGIKYNARDDRDRQGRTWRLGYKWSFAYDCSIEVDGDTYTMSDSSGTGPSFEWDDPDFKEQASWAYSGVYALTWSGSNLVLHRRYYGSMSGNGVGCESCAGGTGNSRSNVNPPYTAWGAMSSYTLEPADWTGSHFRLISETAPDGSSMNFYYDSNNAITTMVTAVGNVINFSYSNNGYLTNITDVIGNRSATFAYSNDCLVQVTDTVGQTFKYGYDDNGFMTSLTRPNVSGEDTTTMSIEGTYIGDYKVSITYPEGNVSYVRLQNGIQYDNISGLGEQTTTYADSYTMGKILTGSQDALGRQTTYEFHDDTDDADAIIGLEKKAVFPDGTSLEFMYDDRGYTTNVLFRDATSSIVTRRESSYTFFDGTDFVAAQTDTVYDVNDNVLSRDSREFSRSDNETTSDPWDDVYTLVSEKQWITADQYSETKYVWDPGTWLLSEVQQLVAAPDTYRTVKTFKYNNDNRRVVSVQDALTNMMYGVFDNVNRLIAVTNAPNGGTLRLTRYGFDSLDRMTNMMHPDGISESWHYAVCGCGEASHTDRGGNVHQTTYDHNKRVKTRKTTSTNSTVLSYVRFDYYSNDQIAKTYDILSNHVDYVYNAAAELTETIDELGRITTYLFDSQGRQYLTIYPDNSISSNVFDSASRVIETARYASINSSTPLTFMQYSHDPLGRVSTKTDALVQVTSNTVDFVSRTIKVTYPEGSFSETKFDLLGNVIELMGPVFAGATQQGKDSATTSNSFDVLNRLVSTTDPELRVTSYEYSPDWPQKTARMRDNNNHVVQEIIYDPLLGYLLTNVSYDVVMSYSYDLLGQNVKVTWPDGSFATNTYDGTRLVRQISRTGNTTSLGFDLAGRRTSVTNSLGAVTRYFLDTVGNVTNTVDALTNRTFFVFDSMNRQTVTTRPDGSASTNTWDLLGRLVSKTGAGSVPVFYGYDALSRMTNLVDGMTNATAFAYDALSRLRKKTYADGTFYLYSYNSRGWLTNRLDAMSRNTAYQYNNVGQLTNMDYAADTDVRYFLDTLGRATGRVDNAGTWSWTYDGESSRVLSESLDSSSLPSRSSVQYSYAPSTFDLASVNYGSYTTLYSWASGRLTNVSLLASSAPLCGQFSYQYKPNADLLQQTVFLGGTVTVYRAWDILDRLTCITATNSALEPVNSFSYTLDSLGRRTARMDADGSMTSWKYDAFDQLTNGVRSGSVNGAADAAYKFGYKYDLVGNRLHEDRGQLGLDGAFNNLNQLRRLAWTGKLDIVGAVSTTNDCHVMIQGYTNTPPFYGTNWLGGAVLHGGSNNIPIIASVGADVTETNITVEMPPVNPEQFVWDLNGNLTSDGQRVFTWDNENRLATIETVGAVSQTARKKSTFRYDAQSRRIQKKDMSEWNGTAYATTNTTHFVWDGWLLLAELPGSAGASPASTNYNVWGLDLSQSLQGAGGIGGLLCRIDTGTNYHYTFDGNGNVTDVLRADASVAGHYEFDPFGRTVAQCGSYADQNPWRFSTKQIETVWDLYHYGYRFYDNKVGKWTTIDPLGVIVGLNVYQAFLSNPVNLVDRLGLWQVTIGGGLGFGFKLTFGSNYGVRNVGLDFGYALGGMLAVQPTRSKPDSTTKGFATKFGVIAEADAKAGKANVSGKLSVTTTADTCDSYKTSVTVGAGATIPKTPVDLGGELEFGVKGSQSAGTMEPFLDPSVNPPEIAVGAMVLGGVTAGVSW